MATKQPQQGLADYVTIALSPLLIMALVGSLVFFLLEILYVGQFPERMKWTLFFFVFGAVLIARISMEDGIAERAGLYGIVLGGVVYLALVSFVEYTPGTPLAVFGWAINLGLIGLIWWCAHRLTWDCTHIDDSVDASGQGVLDAAGLAEQEASSAEDHLDDSRSSQGDVQSSGLLGWWQRYRRYRKEQLRKPHTPGVWVVYFSLAALPLFGLGQSLIPADAPERRRSAFWLMGIYVASGLGLLLTTSFLGLRRYLRQRKLQMPAAMTGVWLTLGGALIVGLLVVGALLPRPHAEYTLVQLTPAGSKEREASRHAVQRDSAGKGEGRASTDPAKPDQKATSGSGTKPDKDGGASSKTTSSGPNSSSSKSGQKDGSGSGEKRQGKQGSSQAKEKSNQNSSQTGSQQEDEGNKTEDKDGQQKSGDERGTGSGSSSPSSPRNPVSDVLSKLNGPWVTILKWIVFGVLALVVAFLVLRSLLRFLANFTDWAQRLLEGLRAWWQGLFDWGQGETMGEVEGTERAVGPPPRAFASYRNPFLDGTAAQQSPDELVRYSFEALQAWAREREFGRRPEETPLEFADRLAVEVPGMEAETKRLAGLYARVAYARGSLTTSCLDLLRQFWERLETVEERPLSA